MVFSSTVFLFAFLPFAITGYYVLRGSCRLYFLLLASLLFYAWGEPRLIAVMLLSICLNYFSGLIVHAVERETSFIRRSVLCASVLGNLGILFYYKYLAFSLSVISELTNAEVAPPDITMPIGISFFTFQGMSYVIDLYKKNVDVQKNPAYLALYISFFPQLIAGPIVRYITIEEQIYKRTESPEKFVEGAKRFILGLSKKVILANTLAFTVDEVFSQPVLSNTMACAWVGIVCYAFQIYFDFSGYSDMAIGLGKMFGFDFLENFNYPYVSKSITEFWRRWHISLSTWFRDYLYIPLGGNRTGNTYFHLLIVFLATGIWHGASFNFIVWGLWHGLFLILERVLGLHEGRNFAHWLYTMLVVLVGWVFFRADNLHDAVEYLGILFGVFEPQNVGFFVEYYLTPRTIIALAVAAAASLPVLKTHFFETLAAHAAWKYLSTAASLVSFAVSIAFVLSSTYNPFIYFRF